MSFKSPKAGILEKEEALELSEHQSAPSFSSPSFTTPKTENDDFVETKITTKHGIFNFRVYAAPQGKETVVLWTENLDITKPVLVRVHSECLTGDLFESCHCDCGEQLEKSLEMIHKQEGVLIYLRQEGRGIGLFEKIKTYQLQSKGYDTFDANIILGHDPDERTYEMVKTALNDLNITTIRLLTNNPSKVSEIAKMGIMVEERVPVIIKPNEFNKEYFKTKNSKFHHCFNEKNNFYFYQFHVETPLHVKEIGDFLKEKNRDCLQKILVGVYADHSIFSDAKEQKRIEEIFKASSVYNGFTPVLHFSFKQSNDVIEDINSINELMPFVKRLQINDLPSFEMKYYIHGATHFSLDIPLSDDNFDLIHNKIFREFIKKTHSFLLLDNSKGRGLKESNSSLMKKIDILLDYQMRDISICGGFGPNDLDRYFKLRRFYRINFSIDAESKLKTDGKVDIDKTKIYLQQLIRFDNPKQKSIDQTRKFLYEHRCQDWDTAVIQDKEFLIHPKVFHAGFFPSTRWFAEKVATVTKDADNFCEVGCGSGVISCIAALTNPNLSIVATDINPFASENTELNAKNFKINHRLAVMSGDVLDNIPKNARFDYIFWALPFGFLDPGTPLSLEEQQVFDPGYRAIRKFFQTAKKFLKPKGKLLLGFSSDLGHGDLLEDIAKEYDIKISKIDEKALTEEDHVKFQLLEGKYS